MNHIALIAFTLSILSIVLGFVALLKQKTYLDSETKEPVEIEVPIIGRMKTNYPAMVFVFLGFSLAFFVVNKCLPLKEVEWVINGQITDPEKEIIDWKTAGNIEIHPKIYQGDPGINGNFRISISLEEGTSFESAVEYIKYSHTLGDATIYPAKEYTAYSSGQESLIKAISDHTREYKPIALEKLH